MYWTFDENCIKDVKIRQKFGPFLLFLKSPKIFTNKGFHETEFVVVEFRRRNYNLNINFEHGNFWKNKTGTSKVGAYLRLKRRKVFKIVKGGLRLFQIQFVAKYQKS